MPRFVVLLRGINVGRNKRIAMADLRELLVDAGYTAVTTHLNSGNAVVTGDDEPAERHAARVEAAITARTGLDVRCVVVTSERMRAIVDGMPLDVDNGSRMNAHVLSTEPDPRTLADALALDPERARGGDRVIYQWCPDGLLEAPPVWTADLGLVTTRNWNTMTKLVGML